MRVFGIAALALAFLTPSAFCAQPAWVFNNGDGENAISLEGRGPAAKSVKHASGVAVGQGIPRSEFGLFSIEATGTDCTVQITSNELAFDSANAFFAMRYKTDSKVGSGGLFFTNDVDQPVFSDKSYSQFEIVGNDEWNDLIVDMRTFAHKKWEGTIRSFRLDPVNPSEVGDRFEISRLGFFKDEESARAFLAQANDEPNMTLDASVRYPLQCCVLPGGTIDGAFDRSEFKLRRDSSLSFPLNDGRREEVVVVRDGKDGAVVEPLCDVSSFGFASYCVSGRGAQRLEKVAVDVKDVAGRASEKSIRFVLARGLMSVDVNGAFRPTDPLGTDEFGALTTRVRSFAKQGAVGAAVAALADKLDVETTREEAAVALTRAICDALETPGYAQDEKDAYSRERIRIGAWGNFVPNDFDDDYMRTYADCGFDFLLAMSGVSSKELLNLGKKYGVEVCVNDGSYLSPETSYSEYCDYPNLAGCYVVDEPGSDDYDKLAAVCNPYVQKTGKIAYVNLLPMYANAAQLKYGASAAAIEYYDADPDLFRKYCAAFCEKFDSNYICTDIYPLNWVKDGAKKTKLTYADYVESINIIASVAREYEREFWCYIQTFAWISSKRTPSEAEYRWQCYSMLSFGCRCILCWTYGGYEEEFPSLVDVHSEKSTAWYDARPVFWELRRLSDEYVKYRNLGAFTHNCSEETPYLRMGDEYQNFEAIEALECEEPLLVGCFEKKDGSKGAAFTLVNMSDLERNVGATVRMRLQGETATAWYRGIPQVVEPDSDGWFTFSLASGEGVFITID